MAHHHYKISMLYLEITEMGLGLSYQILGKVSMHEEVFCKQPRCYKEEQVFLVCAEAPDCNRRIRESKLTLHTFPNLTLRPL